jgi:hypothetical protein
MPKFFLVWSLRAFRSLYAEGGVAALSTSSVYKVFHFDGIWLAEEISRGVNAAIYHSSFYAVIGYRNKASIRPRLPKGSAETGQITTEFERINRWNAIGQAHGVTRDLG